jgi:hypothetical protein
MPIDLIRKGPREPDPPARGDWTARISHLEYPGMAVESDYAGVTEDTARQRAEKLEAQVAADPAKFFGGGA